MSPAVFERLLYTDCRPGQGRRGANGFQIQAQSEGVDPEQEQFAVAGALLYVVQEAWTARQRPVAEFPLGFSHAHGAGFGTAQSRYLGAEAVGGRQGNHLADCLLSRDPRAYGAMRPAQLWRAPFWRSEPWPDTTCPRFDDYLEPGPLTHETIAGWVRALPDAEPLAKLLTVLEDRDGRRVVVVADEPDEVMPWIAAATLLLPLGNALEVSFKVFVDRLAFADQRVCAVPRELASSVSAPSVRDHWFVLDAATGACGELEVSARASFWTDRLARAEDPYDVVEAVELAAELSGPEDAVAGTDVRHVAWAVAAPAERPDDCAALSRWLSGARPPALARCGTQVVAAVLRHAPVSDALRPVDELVSAGRVAADAAHVRTALLAAETQDAANGRRPPAGRLPAVDVGAEARRDAESDIASAILNAEADTAVDALLAVAHRHGIDLPVGPLTQRLHGFVAWWIETGVDCDTGRWALREELTDLLHQQLSDRLAEGGTAAVSPAVRKLWPLLLDDASARDATDPLSWHAHAAALAAASPARRRTVLETALRAVARSRDVPAAARGVQWALLEWRQLSAADAMAVVVALPPEAHLDPTVLSWAQRALADPGASVDPLLLDVALALYRRGQLPDDPAVTRMVGDDQSVREVLRAIVRVADADDDLAGMVLPLKRLRDAEEAVLQARIPQLLDASVQCPQTWTGAVVLQHLPASAAGAFVTSWRAGLRATGWQRRVALGLVWAADDSLPDKVREWLVEVVRERVAGLGGSELDELGDLVRATLPPDLPDLWEQLVGRAEPGERRRFRRRAGRDS